VQVVADGLAGEEVGDLPGRELLVAALARVLGQTSDIALARVDQALRPLPQIVGRDDLGHDDGLGLDRLCRLRVSKLCLQCMDLVTEGRVLLLKVGDLLERSAHPTEGAMKMRWIAIGMLAVLAMPVHAGDCDSVSGAWRLYRTSSAIPNARLPIATFDAPDGSDYNRENCAISANLRMGQPGVVVVYWCEPAS
jgi:hypothetical protein